MILRLGGTLLLHRPQMKTDVPRGGKVLTGDLRSSVSVARLDRIDEVTVLNMRDLRTARKRQRRRRVTA